MMSNGISVMVLGFNKRLSTAGEGVVPDILSTLGHLDAIVPSI